MVAKTRSLSVCSVFLVWLSTGCSKNPEQSARISGKVKMNGNLVTAGNISFFIADHGSVSVPIKEDGTYEVNELPPGEAVVTIETESANPNKPVREYKGSTGDQGMEAKYGKTAKKTSAEERESGAQLSPGGENRKSPGTYTKIPARYADRTQSNLSVTISKGGNKKDFELTD